MKTSFLSCMAVLALLCFSCEREAIAPEANLPTAQLAGNNRIPSYTMAEMGALLAEQQDEAAFVKKTELTAYILTRWLGEHAGSIGLTGGGTLSSVIPCDMGWLDDGGILRVLGQSTGIGEAGVAAQMSAYMEACVKDCNLPAAQAQSLVYTLLGSLVHEGQLFALHNQYFTAPAGNQPRIFVSHGVGMRPQGLRALGFQYQLNSGLLTYEEKALPDAMNQGVLLLDAREVNPLPGSQRFINPCGGNIFHGGSGGNGGGGSGGSNLDDDGAEKGYLPGPLFSAGTCPTWNGATLGLRVTSFHLADRNEGGLFSGQSEVCMSVTMYASTNPLATYKTNENGPTKTSLGYTWRDAKQLAEVNPSNVSTSQQDIIFPGIRNWSIIDNGICPNNGGYNRFIITFFEKDGPQTPMVKDGFVDLPGLYFGDYHWCRMTQAGDIWYSNHMSAAITLDQLVANGNVLYLSENQSVSYISTVQPPASNSWFRIELF